MLANVSWYSLLTSEFEALWLSSGETLDDEVEYIFPSKTI